MINGTVPMDQKVPLLLDRKFLHMEKSKYLWVIDAGHGGLDAKGNYTTLDFKKPDGSWERKWHIFEDGLTIYEGVTNRAIAKLVYEELERLGIDFALVYDDVEDNSLYQRVTIADNIYRKDKRAVYLSIHSDRMPDGAHGKAHGCSVWTSPGQTRSDAIAQIFFDTGKRVLPGMKWHSDRVDDGDDDHEARFYVLRKTDCPAVLCETGFYDFRPEAEWLLSKGGQAEAARYLVESIKECERRAGNSLIS